MYNAQFFLGVTFALISGLVNNLGTLIQKKAVNDYMKKKITELSISGEIDREEKLSSIKMSMKELMLNKTWLVGFISQLIVATAFFIWAQVLIGPSLTPAIGSFGLIVIVFASCLVQEKLTWDEYVGIALMTIAVFFLGMSDLEIKASETDFLEPMFVMRVVIFSGTIIGMCFGCRMWATRKDKHEGTMLALLSGLCIALSNFWVSPLTSVGAGLFSDKKNPTFQYHHTVSIVFFVLLTVAMVVISNVVAIYERQLAFRVGHAATMIPISHIPSHLSAPIIYSLVFFLPQPASYSLAFMWLGIVLLLVSSFIFGKREAMFEQKQRVADKDPGEEIVPLV